MHSFASRPGRWSLAFTLVALGACADEPAAPTIPPGPEPNAALGDIYTVTNTSDSGIGSLRWALGVVTGGETIRFDPGLAGQTIIVDSTLRIASPVTIEGPAGRGITISAGGKAIVLRTLTLDTVRLRNLSITGGTSLNGEGGGITGNASLVVENSAFHGNRSFGFAAIHANTLTLINSTVSGNTSTSTAGYPAVSGRAKTLLINSTVAHNTTGGVWYSDALVLSNSILANNSRANCAPVVSVTRVGMNVSDDDTCGGASDLIIADPKLATLTDNGGPARTHALLAGSPAINAGTSCSVQVDQRYVPRDAQCDPGAFEFTDFTTVTITIDQTTKVNATTLKALLTGTIKCTRNDDFRLALELHQDQKLNGQVVDVHSASDIPITCTTTARPWSASMTLVPGEAFQPGAARATAATFQTPEWVTPASAARAVKISVTRK